MDEIQAIKNKIMLSAVYFVYALDTGRVSATDAMNVLFDNVDELRKYHIENGGAREFTDEIADFAESCMVS